MNEIQLWRGSHSMMTTGLTRTVTQLVLSVVIILLLSVSGCTFSTRSIYNEDEQAVAEKAVSHLHDLYNQSDFDSIHALRGTPASDTESRSQTITIFKSAMEAVGKVKSSKLVEKKVVANPVPGYTTQVRLAYETEFEKAKRTELFVWNIRDSKEAVLADYEAQDPTGSDHTK
jgi:hypothetical protein